MIVGPAESEERDCIVVVSLRETVYGRGLRDRSTKNASRPAPATVRPASCHGCGAVESSIARESNDDGVHRPRLAERDDYITPAMRETRSPLTPVRLRLTEVRPLSRGGIGIYTSFVFRHGLVNSDRMESIFRRWNGDFSVGTRRSCERM